MNEKFLEALGAALRKETVSWTKVSRTEWQELFQIASKQQVLPLIYEAVCKCPAAKKEPELLKACSNRVMGEVARQVMKTSDFLSLYPRICSGGGYSPLVMKGLVCRNLYLTPNTRPSLDEDILIPEACFPKVHQVLIQEGMRLMKPEENPDKTYEVSYVKKGTFLYLEVHKHLFAEDSETIGDFNGFFEGVFTRAIQETIQGVPIWTMGYTDHLFYLICHAVKHFLHSGVGVRQVCDIVLFANAHGAEVDWNLVYENCQKIHAEKLVAAIFKIGKIYFGFDAEKACYPSKWQAIETDEKALLYDMLEGGITGNAEKNRLHSSSITMNAVNAQKKGKRVRPAIFKSIFPALKYMEGKYPYLEKKPYLLPVAWLDRIIQYGKWAYRSPKNHPARSIEIANRRIALMRQYGIIEKN